MKKLLTVATVWSALVFGQGPDTIYLDGSGRQVSPVEAVKAALGGAETYKCSRQELAVNEKSGSIRVKNRGKALTKEQAQQKIEDLKKRVEK